MNNPEFVFFWGGPLSQWHPCKFTIEDVSYNCAEQYMMACKAHLFNDWDVAGKIMETTNPRIQKAYGRRVRNFDKDAWEVIARNVVYRGNHAKFTQDAVLQDALLRTGEATLVEASPYDNIWGIGLAEDDPRIWNPDLWLGKNWLGEILTSVREDIKLCV